MSTTTTAEPRVIVIPRELEGYFYGRLTREFAGREDVRVIVDRRAAERRRPRRAGAGPITERRSGGDRRTAAPAWSLPEMPFSAS